MNTEPKERPDQAWRQRIYETIFEAETPAGRAFDIVLLWLIIFSVLIVMIDSVKSVRESYGVYLYYTEWAITLLFTVEYLARLLSVKKPLKYAFSFYGIIDLLAILPSYVSLLLPGTQYLLVVRILRLLRVFRILKLSAYVTEGRVISAALIASRRKIFVFLLSVISIVVVVGSLMYVIEGEEHGFVDIPTSIYWAIVTLTTVGYGDLSPKTPLGQFLAAAVMIMGYGIIAVPTGIVTAELTKAAIPSSTHVCPECHAESHDFDAKFCKHCGSRL